jgi:primary-amine oxidase
MKRAGFLKNHLWVTPYHPDEKYPAGDYPNKPDYVGDGLPRYTQNNRPIDDKPLVVWYTIGKMVEYIGDSIAKL